MKVVNIICCIMALQACIALAFKVNLNRVVEKKTNHDNKLARRLISGPMNRFVTDLKTENHIYYYGPLYFGQYDKSKMMGG